MDKTVTDGEGPPGWHADRFDRKPGDWSTPVRVRRSIEVSAPLLGWGADALTRARTEQDWVEVRDAGWLLGGLTRSVVIAVMHHFQQRAPAALERGIQRLGELCGALFLEHLCATRQSLIPISPRVQGTRRVELVGRWLTRRPRAFAERLEEAFALTPGAATKHFLAFISATEKQPDERLRRSIYGQYGSM